MYTPEQRQYWRQNIRLIAALLTVWAAVSLGAGILLVEVLNRFNMGNVPLGFWIAQQGAIFVFVALIYIYAKVMDGVDHRHHMDAGE